MLITLSGLPGSGTSTLARKAASALGIDHLDGGTVFRSLAAERGFTLREFVVIAEHDESIDRALDARLESRARGGDVLLESRLAGWLVSRAGLGGLKVWLGCDDRERARRVAARDGGDVEDALATNMHREASEHTRYRTYYDIDLSDLSVYDLVLDSTKTGTDELLNRLLVAAGERSA